MDRRSLLKAFPFLSAVFGVSGAQAAPAPERHPGLPPPKESAPGVLGSVQECVDAVRRFVAEKPASRFDTSRGGTVVLSADNPEERTVGWSAFRLATDDEGNILLDEEDRPYDQAVYARVPITRALSAGLDPRLRAMLGSDEGRRRMAAWMMSGLELDDFLRSG